MIQKGIKENINKYNEGMTKRNFENLIRNNPLQRWTIVNKILGRKKDGHSKICLSRNGQLTYDDEMIAEMFAEFF